MHRKIERRLKFATVLLVVAGYFGLITTFSYEPEILVVPMVSIALMPLGEWLDRRFRVYRRFTSAVILGFVALGFVLIGRFDLLDGVIALIMFIHVYSLLHQKTLRNYVHLFLMSFFLLLAATVMSPRPDIAIVFVVFLLALTWAMTLLEMFAASLATGASNRPAPTWRSTAGEIVPAALVRGFDLRFVALLLLATMGVLTLSGGVFMFGPRTEAGVFGAGRPRDVAPVGLSNKLDLESGGVSSGPGAPVMRVQFPEEDGGQFTGPMLWRVAAMDAYTGAGWQHRGMVTRGYMDDEKKRLKSESRIATREGLERPSGKWPRGEWSKVYYEIYLDRPPVNGVPLLHLVTRVVPGAENPMVQFRWDYANDFSVVVQARGDTGIALSAESDMMNPPPEVLRAAPSNYDAYMAQQDLAQLTYQDLLPETLALVQRLTRNATTPYDRIMALQRYLNGADFEYSRVVPALPSKNAMDAFILRERRGHCQFFASALALMVRSVGVPARVVQGYRGGTWDASDQSYTVTEDMAHLWTEVYFPTVGWIAFDPSPMDRQEEVSTIGRLSRLYSRYALRARLFWLRNVVAYNNNDTVHALRDFSARIFSYGGDTWDRLQSREHRVSPGGPIGGILASVAGVSAAGALGWALLGLRGRRRRRVLVLTADQRRAARLYGGMQRRLRKLGVTCEGRTAEEIAAAAQAIGLSDVAVIPAAVQLYNDARFGRRALSASEYATWRRRIGGLGPGPRAD